MNRPLSLIPGARVRVQLGTFASNATVVTRRRTDAGAFVALDEQPPAAGVGRPLTRDTSGAFLVYPDDCTVLS